MGCLQYEIRVQDVRMAPLSEAEDDGEIRSGIIDAVLYGYQLLCYAELPIETWQSFATKVRSCFYRLREDILWTNGGMSRCRGQCCC